MTLVGYMIGGLVTISLFVYLVYALVRPDRF